MRVDGADDQNPPLLVQTTLSASSAALTTNPPAKRDGNTWTALAHIITAVIGTGILTLAWSMAQLGWVAAPLTLLSFVSMSYVSASLLCNCYKCPDPDHGPSRNGSFVEAVGMILGKRSAWVSGVILQVNFFKTGIVYTIASAISMRAIQQSNCYHYEGHQAACEYGNEYYMLLFGIIQVVLSQMPNFHDTLWLSIVAAIMSFTYSSIGSALGLAKVIENGKVQGSLGGVPKPNAAEKLWSISLALGDIAFSLTFSTIILEIQDTLSPPLEKLTMKRASAVGVSIIAFFYLCCGGFGYAAFGNSTPGNLLTGFGFYEPYWLVDFANACVALHLVGGYQLYSQSLFATAERWISGQFPASSIVHNNYSVNLPLLPALRLNNLRLCFRTAYVALTTAIAITFPYFNQVVGVAGAIFFWPIVVYFPVEMYIVQKKIGSWTRLWITLRTCTIICFLIMLFAFVGSVKELLAARLN